jgi:hypothetical protein
VGKHEARVFATVRRKGVNTGLTARHVVSEEVEGLDTSGFQESKLLANETSFEFHIQVSFFFLFFFFERDSFRSLSFWRSFLTDFGVLILFVDTLIK